MISLEEAVAKTTFTVEAMLEQNRQKMLASFEEHDAADEVRETLLDEFEENAADFRRRTLECIAQAFCLPTALVTQSLLEMSAAVAALARVPPATGVAQ